MRTSILVADGDPEIRNAVESVLRREGYRVTCADSGYSALKHLQSKSFDAVVTDIRMPDFSGLEFLERVRDVDGHVKIVILSGFTTIENVIKSMRDVGAADYLLKPLNNMDELVNAVEMALKKENVFKGKGGGIMKAGIIFTGTGPILILTTYESFEDPKLVAKLAVKGIRKYIASEVPLETAKSRYGKHFSVIMGDLHQTDDLRVLDYNGYNVFHSFSFKEMNKPVYYEEAS